MSRILLVLALLAVVACETVPVTGRSQLLLVSEGEETKMGIDAYQGILKKSKVSSDPRLNEQVTRVGQRIAAATARNDYQWEFKVLEDTQANAFCLPGGKVAVYTGILPITRDDAGLAAVLGHEVSHAIARHGGERMSQTLVVQTSLAATQTALAGNDPLVVQSITALLLRGYSGDPDRRLDARGPRVLPPPLRLSGSPRAPTRGGAARQTAPGVVETSPALNSLKK